ncbi:uncharacterized protein si:dkeyp-69c1.9 [Osmerus eperlanus]|uniref:uncharacterized protein si:dkeyp-69c1.9 n=1 Tax=Osmerus eperlanus TaxID=29151 RepID=UPI002E0FCE5B
MSKDRQVKPDTSRTPTRPNTIPPSHARLRPKPLQLLHPLPCRGELPALAGLLLYPDTPDKMESMTQQAFRPRPGPRPDKGRALQSNLTLEGDRCFLTTQREAFHPHPLEGAPRAVRRRPRGRAETKGKRPGEDEGKGSEEEGDERGVERGGVGGEREEMLSLYQQDFPPPSIPLRRRSLSMPPLDNIAINPILRAEFRTVQRDAYPMWSLTGYFKPIARLRATKQHSTYPG